MHPLHPVFKYVFPFPYVHQNPSYGVAVLSEWRSALDDAGAFEILLRTSWLPPVRRCITTEWDPHDCERLLAVFEAWQSILPEDLLQHDLLDGLVLPRLRVCLTHHVVIRISTDQCRC